MAHIATKKYSYLAQAGILVGLVAGGLFIGQMISFAIIVSQTGMDAVSSDDAMQKIMVPANANMLRWVQVVGVFFLFLMPALLYARICHKKVLQHLGVKKQVDIIQSILAVLLIFSAIPLVGALREFTLQLPLGDSINAKIIASKTEYLKQAMVLGRMNSIAEYFLALFIMAILPGIFEELFFRGAVQNLFTRWFKYPVAAILLSAFVFSIAHFEYADFLGRFFLGIVLGWVFYQTGNLWLNILMHAAFNALSVTALYLAAKPGAKLDPAALEDKFDLVLIPVFGVVFIVIAIIFYKNNQKKNNLPGKELLLDNYEGPDHPSWLGTDPSNNRSL